MWASQQIRLQKLNWSSCILLWSSLPVTMWVDPTGEASAITRGGLQETAIHDELFRCSVNCCEKFLLRLRCFDLALRLIGSLLFSTASCRILALAFVKRSFVKIVEIHPAVHTNLATGLHGYQVFSHLEGAMLTPINIQCGNKLLLTSHALQPSRVPVRFNTVRSRTGRKKSNFYLITNKHPHSERDGSN